MGRSDKVKDFVINGESEVRVKFFNSKGQLDMEELQKRAVAVVDDAVDFGFRFVEIHSPEQLTGLEELIKSVVKTKTPEGVAMFFAFLDKNITFLEDYLTAKRNGAI